MKNSFQRTGKIDTKKWDVIIKDLRETLKELQSGKLTESEILEFITSHLALQDENGYWGLIDPEKAPSDVRVDYFYIPTYISTAILMRCQLDHQAVAAQIDGFDLALYKALKASLGRSFQGHGYDDIAGVLEVLTIFHEGGGERFIAENNLLQEFSDAVNGWLSFFRKALETGKTKGGWDEDYSGSYEKILRKYGFLRNTVLFIYGTLLRGRSNYDAYLSDSPYLGKAELDGYALYDLGNYPGMIPCPGELVRGELYEINPDTIKRIDQLEGEGELYLRKTVSVRYDNGEKLFAEAYIYNHEVLEKDRIPSEFQPWGSYANHVWYASYGSNLLKERFMEYINGGIGKFNGKKYNKCADLTPPVASRTIEIPYAMYFGNESHPWGDGGVAFLDESKPGKTLGRAYLITKEQYDHVREGEGNNTNWYDKEIDLGKLHGIPVVTITNNGIRPKCKPSETYLNIVMKGLCESYPYMSESEIRDYLADRW